MDLFGWNKALEEFKGKADEFTQAYKFIVENDEAFENNIELENERMNLVNKGGIIKAGIEKSIAAIKTANNLINEFKQSVGLGDFHALPLAVPIAALAASVTAINYWLNDFNRLRSKMYDNMVDNGVAPAEATRLISELKPPEGIIAGTLRPVMPLVALAGLLWLWRTAR